MKFDYTTRARRLYLKHPLLSEIGLQVNFWIITYTLFFIIIHYITRGFASLYPQKVGIYLGEVIIAGIIVAIIFGIIIGTIDFFVEKKLRGKSIGIEILIKSLLYLGTWYFVVFVGFIIGYLMGAKLIESPILNYPHFFANNMFWASSIYTAIMIVIITFIKQMNKKFGPGVLVPMFFGKYRKPTVEERIFPFMDLKDSTTYAERLGHIKFSEMIQDCFLDVNRVIPPYNAEIYQYVGDEVVLSWNSEDGLQNMNCIKFFFAFRKQLQKRKEYYEKKYGFVPEFKVGANLGSITVAEVGDIKREIAYHGDTINTAARIQSVCNKYGKSFIISENLKDQIEWDESFITEFLDSIKLKGKEMEIKLFRVEEI